jgi:dTMP kinase
MSKGLFITFEGIDGCGKTTQLLLAKETLEKSGRSCVVTREPGGTEIGEKIRGILLSPSHSKMHDECELLLYCAARAQLVRECILPAMERGAIVLCDRFAEATFAYQGHGRGLPMDTLETMNAFAAARITPSLTFVFDISVAVSMERLKKSGKALDRLEKSGREFYEKVRDGYLQLSRRYPRRIIIVPGEAPVETIALTVRDRLSVILNA